MFSAPHTATVRRLVLAYNLKYHDATSAFNVGATVTGTTSHASAIILSGGSIDSGTLVVYNVSGTFGAAEHLTDNGTIPGAGDADGAMTGPILDSYGQPSLQPVISSITCRFFNTIVSNPTSGQVTYSEDDLHVMYNPGTDLHLGDTLTSTDTGYAFTFTVSEVKPSYALGTLHHYTAKLTRQS
jgi:hypothetical protein